MEWPPSKIHGKYCNTGCCCSVEVEKYCQWKRYCRWKLPLQLLDRIRLPRWKWSERLFVREVQKPKSLLVEHPGRGSRWMNNMRFQRASKWTSAFCSWLCLLQRNVQQRTLERITTSFGTWSTFHVEFGELDSGASCVESGGSAACCVKFGDSTACCVKFGDSAANCVKFGDSAACLEIPLPVWRFHCLLCQVWRFRCLLCQVWRFLCFLHRVWRFMCLLHKAWRLLSVVSSLEVLVQLAFAFWTQNPTQWYISQALCPVSRTKARE